MHGDFSRDSFDPKLNFARVLMQQGRLIVDADWNEHSAIFLHYIRTLAADLIGWHGGVGIVPGFGKTYDNTNTNSDANIDSVKGAFELVFKDKKLFEVLGGRYYVNGLLLTADSTPAEKIVSDNEIPGDNLLPYQLYYLDVWEKHVVAELDSSIGDVALGGLDTTTRVKTISQLRLLHTATPGSQLPGDQDSFRNMEFLKKVGDPTNLKVNPRKLNETNLPNLRAFTLHDATDEDGCSISPSSGYTGLENQLYRIEVHFDGAKDKPFWDGSNEDGNNRETAFSLKWSRDNGSIVYAGETKGDGVTLTTKWRDDSRAIQKGDYVELISADQESGTLAEVTSITEDDGQYTLKIDSKKVPITKGESVLVRRWDHRNRKEFPIATNGGFVVKASGITPKTVDVPIEDGIFIQLEIPTGAQLQQGDYWLVPARSATGDIIWPRVKGKTGPESFDAKAACYTQHHYAPIAVIDKDGKVTDLRRGFKGISDPS